VKVYGQLNPQTSRRVVFICGGSLKDKACKRNMQTLHELEENIRGKMSRISSTELHRVKQRMFSGCIACLRAQGKIFNTGKFV
jgi:hypothetical protein